VVFLNPPFFFYWALYLEIKLERKGIEKKFYELCLQVVEQQGLSLYGLDYVNGQNLLRLFVENPQTKTAQLDDCARVDKALTPFFESEDWMPEEVTLEVSSPGVYRDVKEAIHFKDLIGERLALTLFKKIAEEDIVSGKLDSNDKKLLKDKKIIAYLRDYKEDALEVSADKNSDAKLSIKIENIKRANVEPVWDDIKEN
jgi:ribosome maturation factor RimP